MHDWDPSRHGVWWTAGYYPNPDYYSILYILIHCDFHDKLCTECIILYWSTYIIRSKRVRRPTNIPERVINGEVCALAS